MMTAAEIKAELREVALSISRLRAETDYGSPVERMLGLVLYSLETAKDATEWEDVR
jgi:hypothetical protein